ncbi:MAG: hypothetical protein WKG32_13710 [Gemmatimonadaceae bacterium]
MCAGFEANDPSAADMDADGGTDDETTGAADLRLARVLARAVVAWHRDIGARQQPEGMSDSKWAEYLAVVERLASLELNEVEELGEVAHESRGVLERFYSAPLPLEIWQRAAGDLAHHVPCPDMVGTAGGELGFAIDRYVEWRMGRRTVYARTRDEVLAGADRFYRDLAHEEHLGIGGRNAMFCFSFERTPPPDEGARRATGLANRLLRNRFRRRFDIGIVHFRPDQYNGAYVEPHRDRWFVLSDWTNAPPQAPGQRPALSTKVREPEWVVIVGEEFESSAFRTFYRDLIGPSLARAGISRSPAARVNLVPQLQAAYAQNRARPAGAPPRAVFAAP